MDLPKRKKIRLKEYDYSTNGVYFITICTYKRKNILSQITSNGICELNIFGDIAVKYIENINEKYPNVFVDNYTIMPNHIHLLISINKYGTEDPSPTIPHIISWFKYKLTSAINEEKGKLEKIFQRSYYDHVVRNENDYLEIYEYIINNPLKWKEDKLYQDDNI